ncbi:unnamed protein product [Knipowitschia caucasica]
MRRSSRKGGNKQLSQTQKSIASYTVGKDKMADVDSPQSLETAAVSTLDLAILRHELQSHRDDIKMDIGTQILDLKEDISSLRNDTRADIKTLREELTGELAKLSNKQAEATRQMEDMGNTLSDTIDRVAALEHNQQLMTKKCKTLQEKCADFENRSRRCNLRFVGVVEDSEKGNMLTFLPVFIREILGRENFDSPLVIDRAHRSLGPKPASTDRPRSIVACFHYFSDRQKILDLAKSKGKLVYDGRQVHIFPDMTPEVGKMRAAFNDIKRKLRDAGVSYSLFFPAKLVVTVKGERHSFDSPQAAESFYQQHVK